MYTRARIVLTSLLVLVLSGSLALAQEYRPASGRPAFAQQELDQMLAPIALYPDALLSQVLMAATYPIEIVEAARWSRRNSDLDGDRAVRAVEWMDWDPSVKSLVAFPQILARMDENLNWTERLGDAFLAQQADVMDSVQFLRQKADLAGNLGSTEQFRVGRQGPALVIEFANPELIYVPYYNPAVVYGTWWWPTYQPVVWTSWPGYYVRPGMTRGYAWGPGVHVSRNFFFGATDWHRRSVHVVNVNNYYYNPGRAHAQTEITRSTSNVWQHNPAHRRDVPYQHASLHQPAGHTGAAPEARRDFRGHDRSAVEGRGGPGNRPDARGQHGNQPVAQVSPPQVAGTHDARPNRERAPGASSVSAVATQPDTRSATGHSNAPNTVSRPDVEQRPAAADGAGHGANARKAGGRRFANHQAMAPGDRPVPATQRSANVAAPIPASSAAAPQPAGSPPIIQAGPRQVVAHVDSRPNPERAPRSPHMPSVVSQPEKSSASSPPAAPAAVIRPNAGQRPAAADAVGHGANAGKPNTRGPASRQAPASGESTVPASQPSGNAAAPAPSSTAAATPPEGNPRGNRGRARHQ